MGLKPARLNAVYSELGNRKTAFPKDMSFREIYDNKLFIPARFTDSALKEWNDTNIHEIIFNNNTLVLGEPGSGKSFFSYCLVCDSLTTDGFLLVPIDLKTLFESANSNTTALTYEDIMQLYIGDIHVDSDLLFLIDSVDEFCGNEARDEFCKHIILELKKHGYICVLCRRYEFDLYISNVIDIDWFAKILSINEWEPDKEFKEYLNIISEKEGIDTESFYSAIYASEQLRELVKRPLHARMLIYVVKSSFTNITKIQNISDLYEQYFACLATTVRGKSHNTVLNMWRSIVWELFRTTQTANRKIYVSEIDPHIAGQKKIERIISPIVNWSNNVGRKAFFFLHYSFYEFLVAFYFVIELINRLNLDDYESAKDLFRKDFSLEIRHYCIMLLRDYKDFYLWNKLIRLYEKESDNINLTQRRITNNLLLYFIGRISKVSSDELHLVLDFEKDVFSKTSIYWAMCNLDYTCCLLEYLRILQDPEYASFNRGYLLYYYGDLDRNLDPPYEDNIVTTSWEKTRHKNYLMFQQIDYSSIVISRKIIDIFTFIDFAYFHQSILTTEEITCLKTIINGIPNTDIYVVECLNIVNKHLENVICAENGFLLMDVKDVEKRL